MFSPYEGCQLIIQLFIAGFVVVVGAKMFKVLKKIAEK
jgi:hypothetical protein